MTTSLSCPVSAENGAMPVKFSGRSFEALVLLSDFNERIQVIDYRGCDFHTMTRLLEGEARARGYGKIFLKAPLFHRHSLEVTGLCHEATIAGYFSGQPAVVMSRFLDERRRRRPHVEQQGEILSRIRERPPDSSLAPLPTGYRISIAKTEEAPELAALYNTVFASYPFPITDPEYLVATMESYVVYRIVRDGAGEIVAAASAETDRVHRNAEMTDFATRPDQRRLGLAQHLLAALEEDMVARSIPNLYTIARARSTGMNRVFHNRGYELTGTLVNNCHIAGQFEDMHVWCKSLAAH